MMRQFKEHDSIVLLKDIRTTKYGTSDEIVLQRGSLGTIVAPIFNGSHAMVEFADRSGRPYAMPELPLADMLRIIDEPEFAV
jgi:hypothetical protein